MMTIATAAKKWGVSRQTVYDWIKRGLVVVVEPVVEGGTRVVISQSPPPHHVKKRGENRAKAKKR